MTSSFVTSPLPPVYTPDNGDGTYKNPIIFADYSDPDVCRVGSDFYMTASSFSCFPGLPILHSNDLVNWTLIGHGLAHYPPEFADAFTVPQHGAGVWAPAIRYYKHVFYIVFGDPDRGIFVTHAPDTGGPWSPLALIKPAKGWIDPCPFWDNDGQGYLVHAFAASRAGFNNRLDICRMAPDATALMDDGAPIYDGGSDSRAVNAPAASPSTGRYTTVEGPKLYKRNGYYYIFAPGGGVTHGYQIVFRSKNIFGPYDSRIVLDQGGTTINGPHQGAWVTTPDGRQDWFVHFQDRGPYGRVTHLQPMRWIDDWPVIGDDPKHTGRGQPVLQYRKPDVGKSYPHAAPQTSDEFESSTLGLQWQWFGNYQSDWASNVRPGYLRLAAVALPESAPLYNRPNLLLQKFPADAFTVTTKLDLSGLHIDESAGLVVVGRTTASLTVRKKYSDFQIARTQFEAGHVGVPPDVDQQSAAFNAPQIYLRAQVADGGRCALSYSLDHQRYVTLGQPFVAAPDQWIGAKIGLFCNAPPWINPPTTQPAQPALPPPRRGYADFDFFHVQP